MNKDIFVVTTSCASAIPLAALHSEKEAYILANALDGLVNHIPLYKSSREARQDSNIQYEVQRTRGAE